MSLPIRNDEVMRYFDSRFQVTAAKLLPTQYLAVDDNTALTTTLGSCVAACLRDPVLKIGGMNHFLLPEGNVGDGAPARYGSYAMELLINEMMKQGASRSTMEAKVFGGGQVIEGMNSMNIGERNTAFVVDYLKTERIPIVSKDVLGNHPRKVCFLPRSGKAMVKRLAASNPAALVAQDRAAAQQAAPQSTCGGSVDLF